MAPYNLKTKVRKAGCAKIRHGVVVMKIKRRILPCLFFGIFIACSPFAIAQEKGRKETDYGDSIARCKLQGQSNEQTL
jgi:hypothetical protein